MNSVLKREEQHPFAYTVVTGLTFHSVSAWHLIHRIVMLGHRKRLNGAYIHRLTLQNGSWLFHGLQTNTSWNSQFWFFTFLFFLTYMNRLVGAEFLFEKLISHSYSSCLPYVIPEGWLLCSRETCHWVLIWTTWVQSTPTAPFLKEPVQCYSRVNIYVIRGSYRKSWATFFCMRTGNSRRRRVRW